MQGPHREQLISILRGHANLFSWQLFDILGIDLNIIYNQLMLCVEPKSVAQQRGKREETGEKP
ncbi:hypothetical protein CR513_37410, partial [Mucuna pruriens]